MLASRTRMTNLSLVLLSQLYATMIILTHSTTLFRPQFIAFVTIIVLFKWVLILLSGEVELQFLNTACVLLLIIVLFAVEDRLSMIMIVIFNFDLLSPVGSSGNFSFH